ncbi:DMT family transporter [Salimicrobium halophilum]|uniref:Quaternary ammonium compound-resistance protein SugE n=1 Tax=Salimicrobium halophilum TaxID=86666 RepID=A0A1G8U850_9BACI|nr:multidrug efflux SMR transporter [Salimicrobium halophilum]SDJ49210.1 quaternary ammonium compound-resistance protein SugE [Salimicrobium halophilum]
MAWMFLMVAGIGEISAMFFLKMSEGFKRLLPSLLALVAGGMSFYFLSLSLRDLPIGTAYGIWTGIGSAGTVMLGILFFKEPVTRKRILFLCCIISGIIGLKLVS